MSAISQKQLSLFLLLIPSIFAADLSSTCSLSPDPGACKGVFPKFYFDQESKVCNNFSYGGCGGNDNRFDTIKECENMCKQNENINSIRTKIENGGEKIIETGEGNILLTCSLSPERGICKGNIPKFYFDQETKVCSNFSYGGCGGNDNRFDTLKECEDICKQNGNINSIRTKVEDGGEEVVENGDKELVGDILSIDDEEMITEKLDFTGGFKDWTVTNFKLINTSRAEESNGITASPGDGDIVAKPEFSLSDTNMVGTMFKQLRVEKNSLVEIDFYIFVDGFKEQVGLDSLLQNNPSFLIKSVSGEKSVTRYHLDDPRVAVTNGKWKKFRISMKVDKTETIQLVMEAKMGNGIHSLVAVDDIIIKRIPKAGHHLAAKEQTTSTTGSDVTSAGTSSSPTPAAETSGPAVTISANSNVSASQNTSGQQGLQDSTSTTSTLYNNTVTNHNNTVTDNNNTVINNNNTAINDNNTVTNNNNTVINETQKSEEESGFVNRPAEIALIVLVVVFGLSTILLVLKYFHLKKHVGDFEIGSSRQTFDNPAYETSNARYGANHS